MSTTSQHRSARSWMALWIVLAMLGVTILVATLPPASSYGGSTTMPAWVVGL